MHVISRLIIAPALLLLAGCSATIVPPTAVSEPVTVYVLDHGRHSSLVLPIESGGVRYSYGDWNYYVLRNTSLWSGLRALGYPSTAALGRQVLPLPPTPANLPHQLRMEVRRTWPVVVERAAAQRLHRELEAIVTSSQETLYYSAVFDADFVHHPHPYTLHHNSNRVVGDWLEQLGCDVQGRAILSRWRVENPPHSMESPRELPMGG